MRGVPGVHYPGPVPPGVHLLPYTTRVHPSSLPCLGNLPARLGNLPARLGSLGPLYRPEDYLGPLYRPEDYLSLLRRPGHHLNLLRRPGHHLSPL